MSHNLHDSLSELADSGLQSAPKAPASTVTASERIRAIRRRRPALIAGSTAAALILGGTGVFAAVRSLEADREPFPDRPTSSVISPTESPTPDPLPTATPTESAPEPTPTPEAELAVANPDATFPQCGAQVAPRQFRTFDLSSGYAFSTAPATETSLPVTVTNAMIEQLTGTASGAQAVIVRGDVVVGTSAPSTSVDATPQSFTVDEGAALDLTAELRPTACRTDSADEGRLPAGHYSVWASVDVVVTARSMPEGSPYSGSDAPLPESFTEVGKIADLWIGDDGLSTPGPEVAAGWPAALSQEDTLLPGRPGPAGAAIAWVAIADDGLFAASERVFSLGYDGNPIPTICQEYGVNLLMPAGRPATGVGVIFANRADAEAFADLYPDPIVGISDEGLLCYVD